jgi:NADPH-dependent 2,4-dienoyl-CoA reductase/sulfur reductase-like enzyme
VEVLIVGGGPAGLAAGAELRRLGAGRVVVAEREPEMGGIPRLCHHTGFGLQDLRGLHSGPGYARHYVRRAERSGVELRPATTITEWDQALTLGYTSRQGLGQIEARAVLLATGCRERPRMARMVPGSRPAGVLTTGALQRFVYQEHLPVGRRAVIVGAELVSLSALLTLRHARTSIAAMLTEQPQHQIYLPYLPAKWLFADWLTRTPLRTETRIARIVGKGRVEGVEVVDLASGRTDTLACDTVVFSGDWIPEHELARLGGLTLDPGTRGPQVDAAFRTSRRGVFAAGNLVHGAETADVSALEGRRAARQIAEFLRTAAWPEGGLELQASAPIEWVFPNRINTGGSGPLPSRFGFRVREFRQDARVAIYQDERHLHVQNFGHLRPQATVRLGAGWLTAVNAEGGPVRMVLAA